MADGWGTGDGDVEEENRNRIMQKIFGDHQSDEEVVEEAAADDGDGATSGGDRGRRGGGQQEEEEEEDPAEEEYELDNGHDGDGDGDGDGDQWDEGQGESQGSGGMAQGIEADAHDVELGNQGTHDHRKGVNTAKGGHAKRIVTSEKRSIEDEEDHEAVHDVFGHNDEDEFASYGTQDDNEHAHGSLMDDEGHYEELQPENMVDEDKHYEPDENIERELTDKPLGPPLNLVVPPRKLPPGQPDRMNVFKVSNIMGINLKPFDPETYVQEDASMTDESGGRKKIRLEDNVVRYRFAKNADGTESCESNARFVKWKDGSIQLMIGNEVLDGLMQSQGRLLQKMRFMPSSLSSRSHRALTALVDSQNKKKIKMQTWINENDPERVKEENEKTEGENIRANSSLQRKRGQVQRKYSQPLRQRKKLTPAFLEEALEEDEAPGVGNNRRGGPSSTHFEDDLEAEALPKRDAVNVKKENLGKTVPCKTPFSSGGVPRHQVNEYSESEREESEYETDGEDIGNSPTIGRENELDEEEEEDPEEVISDTSMSDENNEEQEHAKERKGFDSDDESSPRKQPLTRRKSIVFDSDDECKCNCCSWSSYVL
uniref:Leo1-like protein n=1 Tax=Leersia perrieri TaxID=77586 RepID=A0A0D9VZ67_9ORYZ